MPVIKENPEQAKRRKRWEALDQLARDAGFDDDAFANTEFSLMPFFELIVEECARIAETQGRTHSDAAGASACNNAAKAIRSYGAMLGNDS